MKQKLLSLTRLRSLLLIVCCMLGMSAWGESVSFNAASDQGTGTSVSKGGITITASSGTMANGTDYRVYSGATLTITSTVGNITGISMTSSGGDKKNLTKLGSPNVGTWNAQTTSGTWTGSAETITFAASSSQVQILTINITYTPKTGTTYTVTLGDDNTTLTEASVGAGVTLPSRNNYGAYTFAGWCRSNLPEETTTEPTIIPAGNYVPESDITLYPVFTRTEIQGGGGVEQLVETMEYPNTNWNLSSENCTDKTSYTLISNGGYVESTSSIDFNSISKVIVYAGSYGTINGAKQFTISDGTNTWATGLVKTNNASTANEITEGNSLTSVNKLRVTSNCGASGSSGLRVSKVEIFVTNGSTTTYYTSNPVETVVSNPVIVLAEEYTGSTTANISCSTVGASIYYTFDAPTGAQAWTAYTEPVAITSSTTIYAKATKNGLEDSEVVSATTTRKLVTPSISPDGGNYTSPQQITISSSETGVSIYYTTNGEEPTTASELYSAPFTISESCTLKAKAFMNDYVSEVASATFSIIMIQDGVFDFNTTLNYGEVQPSNANTFITEPKTWTAGNVTMVTDGKYRWWQSTNKNDLRLYDSNPKCSLTFSVISGRVITGIRVEGGRSFNAEPGTYTSDGVWTGCSQNVVLTMSGTSTLNINKITVTYANVATINLNSACYDGDGNYYGTYSNSSAFVVPEDLTVSEIGVNANGKLNVQNYAAGAIVPANTGVMVSSATAGNHTIILSNETGTSVLGTNNRLRPSGAGITATEMAAADANCKYYRLTMHNGTDLGFYWGAADGAAFALDANKAYLAIPIGNSRSGFNIGGEESGIEAVITTNDDSNVYDLQGRHVAQPKKGLYIVNGKKVIIK